MSFDRQAYIEEVQKKVSVLPKINKEAIEYMLLQVANASEVRIRKIVARINSIIDPAYASLVLRSRNPILSYPSKEDSKGDGFAIGKVMAADEELYDYELTTENLRENVFASARAGHGKTTLVFHFVEYLVRNGIHFVFFDWKQDYRVLARRHPEILVLSWSDLKFNPLTNGPQNMDIHVWHRVLFDILSHSQGLLMATPAHILKTVNELWEEKNGQITFRDLEGFIKNESSERNKENEYAAVAENRIFNINHALDRVINCKYGFDIQDLFHRQVIIEMHPLDFPIASFLIQSMIMHEFHRRLFNQVRMNRKSTLTDGYFLDEFAMICMDEAHLTQWGGQEDSLVTTELSPPPLMNFFSQSRELLIGTFALTQFPHLIMNAFKDNAGTKLVGNVVEADRQRDLAASIGLDRDETKKIGKLRKGYWIANVAGRTSKPFLLHSPMVDKGPVMAEGELLSRKEQLIARMVAMQNKIETRLFADSSFSHSADSERAHMPEIPSEAWEVLNYVFENEFSYQKQITDALGISGSKIVQIRDTLQKKGLVRTVKFAVFDYPQVHYVLTPKILDIYTILGKSQKRINMWKNALTPSRPGYEHRMFQSFLGTQHRKLGWKVSSEKILPDGRRVDLYCVSAQTGYRKAVEIETTTRDLENKVRVLADGHAEEMVLLFKDAAGVQFARSRIKKILESHKIKQDRVWIGLAREYVKLLSGIIKSSETARNDEKIKNSTHETDTAWKQSGNGSNMGDEHG